MYTNSLLSQQRQSLVNTRAALRHLRPEEASLS